VNRNACGFQLGHKFALVFSRPGPQGIDDRIESSPIQPQYQVCQTTFRSTNLQLGDNKRDAIR
jgi:hypothetical protein